VNVSDVIALLCAKARPFMQQVSISRRPRSEHPGLLNGRQLFNPEIDSIMRSVSKRGEIRMLAAGRLGKCGFGKFYLCISLLRGPQAESFHFCIGC
jgi:hypothetical protein